MSQKTLVGSIALDRLIHVKMEKKGKSGMVKGLFIPLEANKLEEHSYQLKDGTRVNEIQLPVRVIVKDEQDKFGQNGFIAKAIGSKTYKAATSEQQEAFKDSNNEETKKLTPILGNVKDFSSGGAPQQNQSNAVSDETFDENDDLPF